MTRWYIVLVLTLITIIVWPKEKYEPVTVSEPYTVEHIITPALLLPVNGWRSRR